MLLLLLLLLLLFLFLLWLLCGWLFLFFGVGDSGGLGVFFVRLSFLVVDAGNG